MFPVAKNKRRAVHIVDELQAYRLQNTFIDDVELMPQAPYEAPKAVLRKQFESDRGILCE